MEEGIGVVVGVVVVWFDIYIFTVEHGVRDTIA